MIVSGRFQSADADEASALIMRTLREVNSKDYSAAYIEETVARLTPDFLIERAKWTHSYVFLDGRKIVGLGAIGPYWDSETDYSLFTIFVLPDVQGRGIGRQIVETLEADDYGQKAQRIEIPSSITGLSFYQHMGYAFKNGEQVLGSEQLYRLEKFFEARN